MTAAAVSAAAVPVLFQQLKWTAEGAEFAVLSARPSTCLAFDPTTLQRGNAGEALFNTPTLLGGQAAKAGLSCASCHRNGRDNPHFLLAGISDKPGTADVTNSFFSAARGNGKFDPVPIPDLVKPGKVSRNDHSKELENFVRTLIVDEFGGQEPSADTLDAIATYIRALRECGYGAADVTATFEHDLELIDRAVGGVELMATRKDQKGALLLIAAIRHQLGVISERYQGAKLAPERRLLLEASVNVKEIGEITDIGVMAKQLDSWSLKFKSGPAGQLAKKQSKSLYNPDLLRTVVAPQRKSG